jgi:uncharacterized protein YcgL (UPF0745 family)
MSYKEYFKQKLVEDLGSPELMANIENKYRAKDRDPSDKLDKIARSPYLYVPHPDDPSKPMRIPEARLHPRLSWALSNAAQHGSAMSKEDIAVIKDFIRQHGHFVGAPDDPDYAYPPKFGTNDPFSVLSNIFGSTQKQK